MKSTALGHPKPVRALAQGQTTYPLSWEQT